MDNIYIIAEIGINHNGNIDLAKKLIDMAKKSGCDAVKFQKRDIYSVYTKEFLAEPRVSPWGKTQREQKEGLEFGQKEYEEIDKYCSQVGIVWFASAWDIESQEFLRQFNCTFNKIASTMIVAEDLLREVASEKRHTFISTGMCLMKDIESSE